MTKTWNIKLADGRLVQKAGDKLNVDQSGALLVIDSAKGGVIYAVGPHAWNECSPADSTSSRSAASTPARR